MKNQYRLSFGLLLLTCFFSGTALAQIMRPPSTEPSRAGERLQIEEERPPVGGATVITLPDESGHDRSLQDGATFVLKGVVFSDLTVFTEEQLRPDYEQYLNQNVTLHMLTQMADAITVHYRNAGYILSRAVIPPQRIKDGIVKIRIVEGYIDKVRFEGDPNVSKVLISQLLTEYADKIRNSRPLNAATLERYLLLIEDLPGVSARATVQPSVGTPGASDLVITVSQKDVSGSATIDNRGTRYMGPGEGGLTASINNALGFYDRTELRGEATTPFNEMRYAEIVHEEQLDSEGTKVAVSGGYTHTHPDYKLAPLDIDGRDAIFSAEISHPFIRSRQTNLFGNAEFDVRQTDVSSLGSRLYDDRLRVLRTGGSYDFIDDSSAINKIATELSKGFSWDTASSVGERSRATGQPDFVKGTMQASRLQPIGGPFSIYAATSGQLSANTLLVAEQFGIGGADFGSAYDPDEILGDSGIAGRVELQYSRSGDFRYLPTYQLYGFYDIGTVWSRNPSAGEKSSESLADIGIGTRFNVTGPLSGGLELAVPMTREVAANGHDGYNPRAFFNLVYRY